jgi:lipopolysaccharide biosynthesis protein
MHEAILPQRSRRLTSRLAHFVWQRLPLSNRLRRYLKDLAFTVLPVAFSWTQVYKNWQSLRATENFHGIEVPASFSREGMDVYRTYAQQILNNSQTSAGVNLNYVPKISESAPTDRSPIQIVAFYLPQFHPIPENDAWWGKGFTEWTNVSKAAPQFLGHYQPHLPGELGFYDLRLVDVMRQQVELARHYGVGGFCFHHYWFGGKRLLERPVNQFLAAKDIDFPFCLCWANENWTRRWDGLDNEVLLAQNHSPDDDIAFIEDILPALKDKRYIRVDDKPVLIVYRASLLPDARATAARWRERCKAAGIKDLYLVAARSFDVTDPRPFGFDAAIEFPPHQIATSRINARLEIVNPGYRGNIYDYKELADGYARQRGSGYPLIKTVAPGWDNEARKPGAGSTLHGSSPAAYARWLRDAYAMTLEMAKADSRRPSLVFVNAWNEWAEGAHLEPDRKFGYAYLHATANVVREFVPPLSEVAAIVQASQQRFVKRSDVALVIHLYHDDLFEEMRAHFAAAGDVDIFMTLRGDISPQQCRAISAALPNAHLAIYPNRGRDIQPFLQTLRLIRTLGYSFACKVHSKKSPHRTDGAQLRRHALHDLLGSRAHTKAIQSRFRKEASVGMIAPGGSIMRLDEPVRNISNRHWLNRLLPDLNLTGFVGNYKFDFVAGSMFWFRVEALARIDDLNLTAEDFEDELGQLDGTLAHALERLFAVVAKDSGYAVA